MIATAASLAAPPLPSQSSFPPGAARPGARRRGENWTGSVFGALLAAFSACGDGRALDRRPPVVLIVLDALGASHVSHLGYERETTPELDAIATEGVSFSRCFSPAPYTLASIPSLLTGRLPDSHGLTSSTGTLPQDEHTLAELLAGAGYRTVAACSQPNGGSAFGNDQGFEEFRELWIPASPDEVDLVVPRTGEELRIPSAADVAAFAQEQIAAEDPRPLFLYLHVLEPHTPFQAPDEFRRLWVDPDYAGPLDVDGTEQRFFDFLKGHRDPPPANLAHLTALYDGNVAWADHNVGAIRRHLEGARMWDEALVVVTSDHGEACWEHERWGHNWELYDEYVGVPLVVKLPGTGGPRGVVADALVSTLDVVPTICEQLDLPLAGGGQLDGRSVLDLLLDPDERFEGRELVLRSHHKIPHLALRTESTKTILRQEAENEDKLMERYRLDSDPGEHRNVSRLEPEATRHARERLRAFYLRAAVNRAEQGAGLSERELALLQELGYAGADEQR